MLARLGGDAAYDQHVAAELASRAGQALGPGSRARGQWGLSPVDWWWSSMSWSRIGSGDSGSAISCTAPPRTTGAGGTWLPESTRPWRNPWQNNWSISVCPSPICDGCLRAAQKFEAVLFEICAQHGSSSPTCRFRSRYSCPPSGPPGSTPINTPGSPRKRFLCSDQARETENLFRYQGLDAHGVRAFSDDSRRRIRGRRRVAGPDRWGARTRTPARLLGHARSSASASAARLRPSRSSCTVSR